MVNMTISCDLPNIAFPTLSLNAAQQTVFGSYFKSLKMADMTISCDWPNIALLALSLNAAHRTVYGSYLNI